MSATTEAGTSRSEPARHEGARVLRALAGTSIPGPRELLLAALGLVALTAAVYGTHAVRGGFLSDDWAIQADVASGGDLFSALDLLLDRANMTNRPLMAVYMALTHSVFGVHMGFHLALAAGLGALMAWSLYLLLRLLHVERVHAGAIAALVLVFPAADSARLWAGAAAGQLTVAFLLLGLALAVIAFRSTGPRAWLLHGASLLLYLSSILLHESTLVGIGAAVLLYRAVAPWRPALSRWLADVAFSAAVVLLVTLSSSAWPRQDFDGQVEHARRIFDQGATLLSSIALPVGGIPRTLVLLLLVLPPLAAALAVSRLDRDDADRARLVRWLSAVVGGFVVVVAAYLIYVPAIPYYLPAATGIANRMNVLASVGFVLIVYGSLVLVGTLVFRTVRNGVALVVALGVAGAVVLGVGYIDRVADDSRRFELAYVLGTDVLWRLQTAVPDPPTGATIYSAGQPIEAEPGFPVFGNTWDLAGAARVIWRDYTLSALPYFPGTTMSCRADGVEPVNPRYGTNSEGSSVRFRSPYGKTVFFHAPSGRHELVQSRSDCQAAAQWFKPGPEYPVPEG